MLLELQHVIKRFGGVTASSDISFSVEEGQIYGIIGPNGAGKTTLFNLITGVYQVSEGDILFQGTSIEGKKFMKSRPRALPGRSRISASFPR